MIKGLVKILFAVLTAAVISGCANNNNYLQPADFVTALRKEGITVERVNPLDHRPLGATEALEVRVAGSGIGVYKFDRTAKISSQRLERISETGKIYFNGIPFPIYETSGSFVLVGLDKNPAKHQILKVLRNFR